MARDFSKNISNYMSLGFNAISPLLSGASKISIHARIVRDTSSGGANDNRIVSIFTANGASGATLLVDGTSGAVRCGGRSQTSDSFQALSGTNTTSIGVERSVGGVLDIAGDAIRVYLDGSQDGSGSVTFGAATYTPGTPTTSADAIGADAGGPSGTSGQWDGRISELAIWTDDIGTSGFASLAAMFSPLLVRLESLVFYMALIGRYSPERDIISGKSGTITGTVAAADHPRVIYPRRRWAMQVPAAAGGGGATRHDLQLLGCGA